MSMLAAGFAARMRKQVTDLENESTPYLMGSVQSGLRQMKWPRRTRQ